MFGGDSSIMFTQDFCASLVSNPTCGLRLCLGAGVGWLGGFFFSGVVLVLLGGVEVEDVCTTGLS